MRVKKLYNVLVFTSLLLICALFLFPVLIMVTNSFMSAYEITGRYSFTYTPFNVFNSFEAGANKDFHFIEMGIVPYISTVSQYARFIFEQPLYLGLLLNSMKITFPIIIGQIIISVPAAYAFEMGKMRFKEALYFIYVVIMLLPLQVTLIPNYIVADFLHIKDSQLAVILPAMFSPFGVFLVRQYFKGIPYEYIEAAKIDGAGNIKIFAYIITPLVKPAVAALSILTFIEYWNLVDQALVFIKNPLDEPLSVYLARLMNSYDMDMIFAASCVYMLPAVLVFLYGQEYMVEGIQLSGIK